jgi:hypothetical protein
LTILVNRRAAERQFDELEVMAEPARAFLHNGDGRTNHFRTDSITRENCDRSANASH